MQDSTIAMMITLYEDDKKTIRDKKNLQPLLDLLCYQACGDNNCMGESSEGEGFSSQHWIPIGIQPLGVSELGLMEKGEVAFFFWIILITRNWRVRKVPKLSHIQI